MSRPAKGAPREVIERVLRSPSCGSSFQTKIAVELFIREFENQLRTNFNNTLVLEFLSTKTQMTPITIKIASDPSKTVFVSPASLAMWNLNTKGITGLNKELLRIHKLTNFPRSAGLCISKDDSKAITPDDVCLTLEELVAITDHDILEALEAKAMSYPKEVIALEKNRSLQ